MSDPVYIALLLSGSIGLGILIAIIAIRKVFGKYTDGPY